MENSKNSFFGKIFSLLFQVVLFLFLASLLLKEFYPETINSIVDISWFLLFIIILGVLTLVFPTYYVEGIEKQIISREFIFTALLGTMIGYNIFLRLQGFGSLGIYSGIISGIAVVAIFFLILLKRRKDTQKADSAEIETKGNNLVK